MLRYTPLFNNFRLQTFFFSFWSGVTIRGGDKFIFQPGIRSRTREGGGGEGGSRDGAVVRALVSHQCDPGSIPRLGVICGLSLICCWFSSFLQKVFLRVLRFPTLLINQHSPTLSNTLQHSAEPLAQEIAQALPVLLTLNKLLYFTLLT